MQVDFSLLSFPSSSIRVLTSRAGQDVSPKPDEKTYENARGTEESETSTVVSVSRGGTKSPFFFFALSLLSEKEGINSYESAKRAREHERTSEGGRTKKKINTIFFLFFSSRERALKKTNSSLFLARARAKLYY